MWSILTSTKSFEDRWIAHAGLNDRGLHRRRMTAADFCARLRRAQCRIPEDEHTRSFAEQGFVVVPDFLPPDAFATIADEARARLAASEAHTPIPANEARGFGARRKAPWGFDRFDGGTLNRFVRIERGQSPALAAFTRSPRLAALARSRLGAAIPPRNIRLYLTVNGDETRTPDDQKVLHRDTFFSNIKFWYFIDAVTADDGPFVYVPGSHRLTPARLAWEEMRAIRASAARKVGIIGTEGAFRIEAEELAGLGLPPPVSVTVPANSLVMADTLGFHRRGDAVPGTQRLALYGSVRPWPFGLIRR
ncbi:phytanoyl-CoA dioxygenase family protein [Zavarzinia sp.]|uniref:phytanoyl-CoA dioxygenase family protein n=1 Tax=Zavarzinia sp. TaxID=2027920 RepID=UPI003BB5E3F1